MPGTPKTPALFLFAHHDDEFFIAVTMRRLAAARLPVAALWLTRGGLHGDRREAESRQAMELIGVDPSSLHFLRLADGRSLDNLEDIVERLMRLMRELKPASIFTPAFEGGHPDHDTAQLAAAVAIRRMSKVVSQTASENQSGAENPGAQPIHKPTLYEFPLYNRSGARLLRVGEFIPGTTEIKQTPVRLQDRLLKRRLAVIFRSQRAIIWPLTGLRGGPMMVHVKDEPYRQVPASRDYAVRPYPGRLAYEYYTSVRFQHFAGIAARAILPPAPP
ncbi:MAG: PIG-L family deacetylase [Thermoleophilia bacterium]|nr:PIG-L family deacetylase [Thermoleophilia bacterium]